MIDNIEYSYLLAFGVLLIALEMLLFSFFLFWIGLGFILVGILNIFVTFDSGVAQIALSLSVGLLLAFLLRDWSMRLVNRTQNTAEIKTHKGGIATIKNGSIFLNGTYWQSDDDLSTYNDGDRVEVIDIVNNRAVIKKSEGV